MSKEDHSLVVNYSDRLVSFLREVPLTQTLTLALTPTLTLALALALTLTQALPQAL